MESFQCNLVGWSRDKIFVENAGFHIYTIRYFDPYTKNVVNEEDRWSYASYLQLENYPLMYDGTNNHQPFYFFEAFLEGSEFNESPMQQKEEIAFRYLNGELDVSSDSLNNVGTSTQIFQHEPEKVNFALFPNPSLNKIVITSDKDAIGHELIIYSTESDLIQRKTVTNTTEVIDITSLASGTYLSFAQRLVIDLHLSKAQTNKHE